MQYKYIYNVNTSTMWTRTQVLRHYIFRSLLMTQIRRRIMGNRIIVSNYGSSLSQLSEPGDSATNANTNTNTNTNTSSPPHRGPIPPHSPPPSPPWIKRPTLVFCIFCIFSKYQEMENTSCCCPLTVLMAVRRAPSNNKALKAIGHFFSIAASEEQRSYNSTSSTVSLVVHSVDSEKQSKQWRSLGSSRVETKLSSLWLSPLFLLRWVENQLRF